MRWLVISLIVLLSILNILLTVYLSNERDKSVDRAVKQVIESIPVKQETPKVINGKDGYTPVNGVDYFDGKDGAKGDKGDIGATGDRGKDGTDAKNLEIMCDTSRNMWLKRYVGDDSWGLLNDEPTKCTVKDDDILKVINSMDNK